MISNVNEWLNVVDSSVSFGSLPVCLSAFWVLLMWPTVYQSRHTGWRIYSIEGLQELIASRFCRPDRLPFYCWRWRHSLFTHSGFISTNVGQRVVGLGHVRAGVRVIVCLSHQYIVCHTRGVERHKLLNISRANRRDLFCWIEQISESQWFCGRLWSPLDMGCVRPFWMPLWYVEVPRSI